MSIDKTSEDLMLEKLNGSLNSIYSNEEALRWNILNPVYVGELNMPDALSEIPAKSYIGLSFDLIRVVDDGKSVGSRTYLEGIILDAFGLGLVKGNLCNGKIRLERYNVTEQGISEAKKVYHLGACEPESYFGRIINAPISQIKLYQRLNLTDKSEAHKIKRGLEELYKNVTHTSDLDDISA